VSTRYRREYRREQRTYVEIDRCRVGSVVRTVNSSSYNNVRDHYNNACSWTNDRIERQELGDCDNKGLTYGEVDCMDFIQLLDLSAPKQGEVFVDLGSGTGKVRRLIIPSSCRYSA